MRSAPITDEKQIVRRLETRLGVFHAQQRIGIEAAHASRLTDDGINFFRAQNWYSVHALMGYIFKIVGLYQRARRNALDIRTILNPITLANLPPACEGLRILHVSDLHIGMSEDIIAPLIECVGEIEYDLCVLTGDYRFETYGGSTEVVDGMARLRKKLRDPIYAVLGNHDNVEMLLDFEDLGIKVLMNEHLIHSHNGGSIYIAGIDDAHFFGTHNIEKALAGIPLEACCVLLSHTPEVYRQAAQAGANLLLSGHTHGGQICLPCGVPLILGARIPRRLANGAWQHAGMIGYTSAGAGTSMVDLRLNCPPEITLHTLNTVDCEVSAQTMSS